MNFRHSVTNRAAEKSGAYYLHPEAHGFTFTIFGSATYFICISQVLISHQYKKGEYHTVTVRTHMLARYYNNSVDS
jgi:hypothetical protein